MIHQLQLVTEKLPTGNTSVVYISPLKALTSNVRPDDPYLQESLCVLHHLIMQEFQPLHRITIETINGEDASRSAYADVLRAACEIAIDYKHMILYRKMER